MSVRFHVAILVVALSSACSDNGPQVPGRARVEVDPELQDQRDVTVTPGKWRSHHPSILNDYYVALAHILVSHKTANLASWQSRWPWLRTWPAPPRSREDARVEAHSLSSALQRRPEQFEAVARQQSDDRVTRPYGGSFGVIGAPNLVPELLDVYEELKVGQVSRAVETVAGFHIVKRLAIPRERFYWTRSITIRYAGAFGAPPDVGFNVRSREEAEALARQVLLRARAAPSAFAGLVDQYSEDDFASVGGEMGPLSNLAGTNDVSSRLALAQLEPLQVSDLLDEARGYVILQRLPDRPVEWRAYDPLFISFDAVASINGSQVERDRSQALQLAKSLARELATDPSSFVQRAHELCEGRWCRDGEPIVSNGSSDPMAYHALDVLAPGAVSAHPILTPAGYMVLRRSSLSVGQPDSPRRIFSLDEIER